MIGRIRSTRKIARKTLFFSMPDFIPNGKTVATKSINLITGELNLSSMKSYFGLIILVLVLVLAAGCTDTPATRAVTTAPTTVTVPPEVTTAPPVAETSPMATVPTAGMTTAPNLTLPLTPIEVPNLTLTEKVTVAPTATKLVTKNVIHILNGSFVPSATTLLPGTGVSWINDDSGIHSVKSTGAHPGMFNSGEILPGEQFSFTFGADEGTYSFNDPKFTNMTGTIIIRSGPSVVGS